MSINDKKLRKQLFLDCGAIKDCEAVIVIEQIAEQSANAKIKKLRKQLFLLIQNCNNKLHTFAPHHTCGVKS